MDTTSSAIFEANTHFGGELAVPFSRQRGEAAIQSLVEASFLQLQLNEGHLIGGGDAYTHVAQKGRDQSALKRRQSQARTFFGPSVCRLLRAWPRVVVACCGGMCDLSIDDRFVLTRI